MCIHCILSILHISWLIVVVVVVVVVVVRSECVHIVMAIAEILQYLHARTSVLTNVVS